MQPFIHFSIVFFHRQHCMIGEVCRQTFLSSKIQRVFHWGIQLYCFQFFFHCASSSSSINCPSLVSSRPLIMFWIGLSVILWGFPSKFLKYFFQFWSLSSWQAVVSFTLEVIFLPLTSFTTCHPNRDSVTFLYNVRVILWINQKSSSLFIASGWIFCVMLEKS